MEVEGDKDACAIGEQWKKTRWVTYFSGGDRAERHDSLDIEVWVALTFGIEDAVDPQKMGSKLLLMEVRGVSRRWVVAGESKRQGRVLKEAAGQ